jgi:hypothetical protein
VAFDLSTAKPVNDGGFDLATATPVDPGPQWRDVPGNVGPSAKKFIGGIGQAVLHPLDTASTAFDAAAGGLRNLAGIVPGVQSAVDSVDTTESQASGRRASAVANQVGQLYKGRYGGLDQIKNTLITDPVGVAADLSTVLGIGGGLASKVGLLRTGETLGTASQMTNPLSLIPATAKVTGKIGKELLGVTTGAGSESIAQAGKAGFAGKSAFWDNLTGKVPYADVIDDAKQAVANMGDAKSQAYRTNMAAIKADKNVLDFTGIDNALSDAQKIGSFKGMTTNSRAGAAVSKVADDIAEWKQLPAGQFHTPEGLDALKQRIGGVLESLPFEEKTARLAVGKVYNSIKAEISKQAPVYAETMADYAAASDLIREIERALSLGKRASADTAMRKLQSLMRNNVNTNYGNRLSLAKTLETQGGSDLMPAIAGQALSSYNSRGLGSLANLGTLGAAALWNPNALALLPMQSPRLVGGAVYGGGRMAGIGAGALGGLGVTPNAALYGGLLSSQAGNLNLLAP